MNDNERVCKLPYGFSLGLIDPNGDITVVWDDIMPTNNEILKEIAGENKDLTPPVFDDLAAIAKSMDFGTIDISPVSQESAQDIVENALKRLSKKS